jgi:glycogen(starch) synthase
MRICHVASEYPPTKIFGLGRFLHGLARAQAKAGDEVAVLTNSTGGAEDDVVIDGVHLHRIAFPNPPRPPDGQGEVLQFNHGVLARFFDRVDRFRNVDVIASHDWLTAIAAREIAEELKRPLVVTFHDEVIGKHFGNLPGEAHFARDLEALTAHDATRVIANSQFLAAEIVQHYGVPAERVTAIPGGIDPAILALSAEHRVVDFRTALARDDEILVLYVGRLDPEKGLRTLAEAALASAAVDARLRFLIAGTGREEPWLREALAPLGPRARFVGYVAGEALALLYRAADIVVIPSLYEPFGLVALEAMQSMAAVVVARSGGLAEIVRDGEDGLLFPPGDSSALADAICRLAREGVVRRKLGLAAAAHVRRDFDWSSVARRTRSVYEEALAAPRPVLRGAPLTPPRPLVSVTIATHNAPVHLEATLRTLFQRTRYPSLEAIVVDNGSASTALARIEAIVAELVREGRAVRLLRNEENRLFSAAQNQAIQASRGEYVCLMNDDVEIPAGSEGWLESLLWLLETMDALTVTPVTIGRDGRIYCAGASGGGAHHLAEELDRPGIAAAPQPTEWNNMACLITRRRFLEGVGFLSEAREHAHYGSDREWCLRASQARGGGRHWVHPVRLYHVAPEAQRDPSALFQARKETRLPSSVVIIAYDGLPFTRVAIEAVLAHTRPPFELVLVDNGSRDGTRDFFRSVRDALGGALPVQLIENAENAGYPKAANQGIRAARGRSVVLLNNDTRVCAGWLDALLAAGSDPAVGVVTAKILNEDGAVQSAGGIRHRADGSFTIPHAGAERHAPVVSERCEVENAGGPCMLLTRALIERVGIFDEAFTPGYFEDSDLCLRAREAGFQLVYEPGAEVFHRGKATAQLVAREGNGAIWRRFEENKRRFYERWGSRLSRDEATSAPRPHAARNRPRVFDCFTFFNELDTLEIRLEELADVVDSFVLVEAPRTFSGQPKRLFFAEHRDRFARFSRKIVHVVVEDLPVSARSAWERESWQRNAIVRGLGDARPEDLVLISDVDEIPRASLVRAFDGEGAGFEQTSFYYALNCRNLRGQEPRAWSVILRRRDLRTPQEARERRFELPLLRDGGWHFSYLGGADAIRSKIQAFSHQELNVEEFADVTKIAQRIASGRDLYERPGMQWAFVPIDATFPRCVAEEPGRWRYLIAEVRGEGELAVVGASGIAAEGSA